MPLLLKLFVTTAAVVAYHAWARHKSRGRFLVLTALLISVGVIVLTGCAPAPGPGADVTPSCGPAETTPATPPNPVEDGSYRDGATYPC